MKHNISTLNHCYGCGVCQTICPTKVISLAEDKDGFIQPIVTDEANCIECGLCLNICSFNGREDIDFKEPQESYAVWVNDSEVRYEASSGGVVPAIFQNLLKEGYVVNCAKYDPITKKIIYYQPDNVNSLTEGLKSKYLQAFFPSKIDFQKDNVIIGTPCAIASIRKILNTKKNCGRFILIDFFCHGVPSYLLWKKYLEYIGISNPQKVIWRDKQNGWHDSWRMIVDGDCRSYSQYFSAGDLFYKFFLKNRCLRKACYDDCVFKNTHSSADIRVGDLWGGKYSEDEIGVSGVLVFTEGGEKVIQSLQENCTVISESVKTVTESQMKKCANRPSSFEYVRKSLRSSLPLNKIDKKASKIELVKDEIPGALRYYSRRIIPKILGR